jgi:serine/threonine protein kinase
VPSYLFLGIPIFLASNQREDPMDESIVLLRNMLEQLYSFHSIGSLSNLRTVFHGMKFKTDKEEALANTLMGYAHMSCFNLAAENGMFAALYFIKAKNVTALTELFRLAHLYRQEDTLRLIEESGLLVNNQDSLPNLNPRNTSFRDVDDVNVLFRFYCKENDLVILRVLQKGQESIRRCSWVYLVWDPDGIVKIYKEVLDYNRGVLSGLVQDESELYETLPENPFFPKHFGVVDVDGIKFLRQSVHFGQTVADYIDTDNPLPENDAAFIIRGIAEALNFLLQHNIAYLDIKPENILVSQNGIKMLDLGISRRALPNQEVDIYIADPRFGTPEGGSRLKGSTSSDIFQLGILFHLLLTGKHPFEITHLEANDSTMRESALLRYLWPTVTYDYSVGHPWKGKYSRLISQMLAKDPSKRPTVSEVFRTLTQVKNFSLQHKQRRNSRQKSRNTVLFPARMGVPHRGHIEYISRLMDLGYHVLISIQHAHTLTDRDPIPKSFIMKMVAQSLVDRGFKPEEDFSFVLTPFYGTRAELEYHHLTMPQIDDVIAVASGNPGVHDLFSEWAILDQNSVFGKEGEYWQTLSWGETLRQAIRKNDVRLFRQYAASGVEKILSLSELQSMYGKPYIEFAEHVDVILLDNGKETIKGRVFRYHAPEQSIVFMLKNNLGWKVQIIDLYAKNTELEINGKTVWLHYDRTQFNTVNRWETIYFSLTHRDEPS